MNDRMKMNMEELKKSFPSVDDFSTKKLLGGNGPIIGFNEHDLSPVYGEPLSDPNPGGNPSGSGPNSGGPSGGPNSGGHPTASDAAWASYFGDSGMDWGNDGFGGSDWGDGGSGGDSNPGGNEGGNGQGSSGNPGNGQTSPDYSDLEFINNTNPSVFESRTYNNSSQTLYGKPDYDTPYDRVIVPPGEWTDVPLDAFKVGGHVYKVTDGYGTLTVYDSFYGTQYSDDSILLEDSDLERMQEWLMEYGNPCQRTDFGVDDTQWDNIFLPP
ncbi:MAG: hypothetical protein KA408_11540 [Flavobacteriales bacterium]|nr:hypothetical protein [Flavobacteriales bacterium]